MSNSTVTPFNELSWQSREILKAVQLAGGTATTTEIRNTSTLNSNRQIKYRFDDTDELDGLATVEQPPREGGPFPPKQVTLTERGTRLAEELISTADVSLEAVAAQVEQLTGQVEQIEEQLAEMGERDCSEVENKVEGLQHQLVLVAEFLNKEFDGGLSTYRAEYQKREGDN